MGNGTSSDGGSASGSRASDTWNVKFRDDFKPSRVNPSGISKEKWGFEKGTTPDGWGNWEEQFYTDSPENAYCKQQGGLCIRLKREPGNKWTSARMTTKGKVEFTYGRVDARIRTDRVPGPFCAVWALSSNCPERKKWPLCGEIDIFEMQTTWTGTPASLHCQDYHAENPISYKRSVSTKDWHVYSVDWTPNYIAFFHDNREIGRYEKPSNATENNWPFKEGNPFHLIINNAMHPKPWGSEPENNLESHILEVDYIEVREYPGN